MQMGQAAGTAAVLAAAVGGVQRDVDTALLRAQLVADGALLEPLTVEVIA